MRLLNDSRRAALVPTTTGTAANIIKVLILGIRKK
jgi:hypothetical protein